MFVCWFFVFVVCFLLVFFVLFLFFVHVSVILNKKRDVHPVEAGTKGRYFLLSFV